MGRKNFLNEFRQVQSVHDPDPVLLKSGLGGANAEWGPNFHLPQVCKQQNHPPPKPNRWGRTKGYRPRAGSEINYRHSL